MGGKNEFVAEESTVRVKGGEIVVDGIRVHESDKVGDSGVHFHHDASNLKVTVPSAVWYKAWERIGHEPGEFVYVDAGRTTRLTVKTYFNEVSAVTTLHVVLKVEHFDKVSDNFRNLQKLTLGK